MSFSSVFEVTERYIQVVLKKPRIQRYEWIAKIYELATSIYNASKDELHDLNEIEKSFEKLLLMLFIYPSTNPEHDIRHIFLDNTEFQKHLKLVAKYIDLDITDVKKTANTYLKGDGSVGNITQSDADERHAAVARLALLNLKALCNNL